MEVIQKHFERFMVCKVAPLDASFCLIDEISLIYDVVLIQSNQIPRDDFVMKLRMIVGDTLLNATMRSLQFKVHIFLIWI